jgi:GntR family transcriptional regulator
MSTQSSVRAAGARRSPASLKHEQIAQTLEREIKSGRLELGGQLPGETVLAERFAVSRNTVRAALLELSRAGLIATRSGKGSFVTYDGRPLDARLGWASALQQNGIETRAHVVRFERMRDAQLAARLAVASDEFIAIDRVRSASEGPAISLERSRVPATDRTRDLPERGLVDDSLTQTLLALGLVGSYGQQSVGSRPLDDEEALTLGRASADWFLHTVRTTWTADDQLVEHVDSVLDPQHFELRLQFSEE